MLTNLRFVCCLWIGITIFQSCLLGQTSIAPRSTADRWKRSTWYLTAIKPFGVLQDTAPSRASEIRNLGFEANRTPRLLVATLPQIVAALDDKESRVRSTAARSLRQIALQQQRRLYRYRQIEGWSELEPLFRDAIAKLSNHSNLIRDQREIERLLALDPVNYSRIHASMRTTEVLPAPTQAFLDEFFRLEEDQVGEMWQHLSLHFGKLDRANQNATLRELVRSAPPRFLEVLLMATDRFDDRLLEILLEPEFLQSPNSASWLFVSATPNEPSIRTRIATQACNPKISKEFRESLMQCLCNSSQCEPNVIAQIVQSYITSSRCEWLPDCWDLLTIHKGSIRVRELRTVVQHALARLEDTELDSWERGLAATTLGQLMPGERMVVDAVVGVIDREKEGESDLCEQLLYSLVSHGSACRSAQSLLMNIVKSSNSSMAEAALHALAQTQELDSASIEYLVNRINQNEVEVAYKVAAAKVLATNIKATMPLLKQAILRQYVGSRNAKCLVDLLCTAESMRHRDAELDMLCQRITDDMSIAVEVRLAAWHARGVCAVQTNTLAASVLACIRDQVECNEVKGAALQTLAVATGNCAIPTISEYTHDKDPILACAARFAYHIAGESNTAVHLLFGLLPSDMEETIESVIQDIGVSGKKALYETLDSPTASDSQRQIAFRTLVSTNPSDWDKLLSYVEDPNDGDQFAKSLRIAWNMDENVVPALFRKLENSLSTTDESHRFWRLVDDFTDGLGAGDDEFEWSPSAIRHALVASAKASKEPPGSVQAETTPAPAIAPPRKVAAAPRPALAPSPASPPRATAAPIAATPTAPSPTSTADLGPNLPPPDATRKVDVFYGTNRQVSRLAAFGSKLRWVAFAVALGCTMFCIVGFARKRAINYAFVALVGLLGLTAMARDSLDMTFWFPHRTKVYSGEYSDEIKLGVCQVTIPKNHVPGELESPSFLLRMEVKWDPEKHVVLENTQPLERDEFFSQLQSCMNRSGKNLLVFVHGYNVSFEDAARRTAQMSVDLDFHGAPVFYSWPSHNDWYRYPDDAENIQASVKQIRSFLEQIARDSKAESIHLIAHSMGNVGLTKALASLSTREPIFNQVILAAPDIDATVFREDIAPKITKTAKRVTLYTSQTDLALLASRYFNAGDRIGDSSRGILSIPGIEVIDATEIDSSLMGHSYYGSNIQVLDDIANLLRNKPLTDRKYLEYQADATPPYWSFSSQLRSAKQPDGERAMR